MLSHPPAENLLNDLLNGEGDELALRELASHAENDPTLATRIGEELEFSELLRQVLRDDEARSAALFEAARSASLLKPEELATRACEGTLTREESDHLAKHLLDHPDEIPELRQRLATDEWLREAVSHSKSDEAFMEALETRMWAITRADHFVQDFEARLDEELSDAPAEGKVVPLPMAPARVAWQMGAVAAAVAVGAFVLVHQIATQWEAEGGAPAAAHIVKASPDVNWMENSGPDRDGLFRAGQHHLDSGVVALKFPSGGEMTVEGPAVFEVTGPDSAFVLHGVALARNTQPGEGGISLKSKGMDIAEPVPLVGIDARSEHSTGVVVFDGDGGICLPGGGCRSLFSGESVRADLIRDKLVDVPYNPQPFARAWELLAGVETNLGPVRIELPGTAAGSQPREGEVQVFLENESFSPAKGVEIDLIRPGHFASVGSNPGQDFQTGGELRSYLLQLWPSDDDLEASLTFDHEVVGVISSSDRLASSDLWVGRALSHVGDTFNRVPGAGGGNCELLLSDDRRTINFRLRGGDRHVDQIRVLVALH